MVKSCDMFIYSNIFTSVLIRSHTYIYTYHLNLHNRKKKKKIYITNNSKNKIQIWLLDIQLHFF